MVLEFVVTTADTSHLLIVTEALMRPIERL